MHLKAFKYRVECKSIQYFNSLYFEDDSHLGYSAM
jgi:hypothetical protein